MEKFNREQDIKNKAMFTETEQEAIDISYDVYSHEQEMRDIEDAIIDAEVDALVKEYGGE